MLSKKSLSAASTVFRHSCLLKIAPFTWDGEKFNVTVRKNRNLIIPILCCVCTIVQTLYNFLRYIWFKDSLTPTKHVLFILRVATTTTGTTFSIHNLINRYELANLINQFFNLKQTLERKYGQENVTIMPNGCERILRCFPNLAYFHCFILSMGVLLDPLNERTYYSMFGTNSKFSMILIPFAVLEYSIFTMLWHSIIFNTTLLMCYWYTIAFWLREINVRYRNETMTKDMARTTQNSLLIYRTFQLLNQDFNTCFQSIIFPFIQLCTLAMPTISNHAMVRFHHKLNVTALLTLPTLSSCWIAFLMSGFRSGAEMNARSEGYLKALQIEVGVTLVKQETKCLKPIRVQFGDYMFLQKFTTCKVFGLIVYWTMRSLLLFHD